MRISSELEGFQPPRWGLLLLQALILVLFVVLALRFWYLQILSGENFAKSAQKNRWREVLIEANRGLILDNSGIILAENSPSYALALIREDCQDIPSTLSAMSQWTGVELENIQKTYDRILGQKHPPASFEPLTLVNNISFEDVSRIEGQLLNWPGVVIQSKQRRYYTEGKLFAHVIGYVSVADDNELKARKNVLKSGDTVGKQGLELNLEDRLRGNKGARLEEVDALGRPINRMEDSPQKSGEDIRLSINLELQKAAAAALGKERGCVVVMDPDTGKILALVTAPAYDNNLFTGRLSVQDWNKLRDDPSNPFQNRIIQSVYPPGSVWKLMMASLFMSEGIEPSETVTCIGEVKVGNRSFRCWRSGGHGKVDLRRSLVESCDVYYYTMSERVGIDKISKFAQACGFGQPTGINIPNEKKGIVPGREWKLAVVNEGWQRGDTLNTSIGQGFTLVTPVQMAVHVSSFLNGGKIMQPLLLEAEQPKVRGMVPFNPETANFIMQAMRRTVEAPAGTAKRLLRNDAVIGAKTGTAQVVVLGEKRLKSHEIPYEQRDHAWMVSWGIQGDKKYVVVVMVEHGGGGGQIAGPVCRAVHDYLFIAQKPAAGGQVAPGYTTIVRKDDPEIAGALKAAESWLQ